MATNKEIKNKDLGRPLTSEEEKLIQDAIRASSELLYSIEINELKVK